MHVVLDSVNHRAQIVPRDGIHFGVKHCSRLTPTIGVRDMQRIKAYLINFALLVNPFDYAGLNLTVDDVPSDVLLGGLIIFDIFEQKLCEIFIEKL